MDHSGQYENHSSGAAAVSGVWKGRDIDPRRAHPAAKKYRKYKGRTRFK